MKFTSPLTLALLALIVSHEGSAAFPNPQPSEKPRKPAPKASIRPVKKEGGGGTVGSGNDGLILKGFGVDCDGCDQPPADPTKLTFAEAAVLFHSVNRPASPRELKGKWKPILNAPAPGMVRFGMDPMFGTPDADWNGGKIGFSPVPSEWTSTAQIEAVLYEVEPPFSKGPYKVTFTSSDSCFSVPMYDWSLEVMPGNFYVYECRPLPSNSGQPGKLLCAVSPRGNFTHAEDVAWLGQTITYMGYVKLP